MPGPRGPIPQHSSQRRRTNAPDIPLESAPGVAAGSPDPGGEAEDSRVVAIPPPLSSWHPSMVEWYIGLTESAQRAWFEPSDWATARLWCDLMSASWPPPSALVGKFVTVAAELMTSEGSRRRLRIELARKAPTDPEAEQGDATVTSLAARLGA